MASVERQPEHLPEVGDHRLVSLGDGAERLVDKLGLRLGIPIVWNLVQQQVGTVVRGQLKRLDVEDTVLEADVLRVCLRLLGCHEVDIGHDLFAEAAAGVRVDADDFPGDRVLSKHILTALANRGNPLDHARTVHADELLRDPVAAWRSQIPRDGIEGIDAVVQVGIEVHFRVKELLDTVLALGTRESAQAGGVLGRDVARTSVLLLKGLVELSHLLRVARNVVRIDAHQSVHGLVARIGNRQDGQARIEKPLHLLLLGDVVILN